MNHQQQIAGLSEAYFRALVENSSDGILVMDACGTVLYDSPGLKGMLGYGAGENLGLLGFDFLHPDDAAKVMQVFAEVLSTPGQSTASEFRVKHKDGTWRHVEGTSTNHLSDPDVKGVVVNFRDVTDRKRAEEQLRDSEKRFWALIENSSDGIAILSPDGSILYGSSGISRMMGYDETETLGFSFADFLNPDDLMPALGVLTRIMTTPGASGKLEVRGKHKDGSWHWFEGSATNHVNDPAIGGIVINLRDISDRKKVEEEFHHSMELYERLIDNFTDGIQIVAADSTIMYQSPSNTRIYGLKSDERTGNIGLEFIHPEDLPLVLESFSKALAMPGGVASVEARFKHGDGTWHWIHAVGRNCLHDPVIKGIIVVNRDITERKRMEQELADLNQNLEQRVQERTAEVVKLLNQKEAFITQLSHDLKSPLTPLVALLPMLKDEMEEADRQEIVDAAITNVNFMRELVTKTLKLAKLASVKNGPVTATTQMRKQLDAVLKGRAAVAGNKNIAIETLVADGIVVQLEDIDLQELFDNIINNAIKFTPEGGRIAVDAVVSEPFVTVAVKDTGAGMNEEQLSHIFEEFYKADPSRHELDSSGLGLSICKRIVERAGGKIWVESEGLGRGSTFRFTLRLAEDSCLTEAARGA